MSISALIADDEPLGRESIRRFLRHHPDIEVLCECSDGKTATISIIERQPQLVFLDIQMPELDGFGVMNQVGVERMPPTIFVTAYDRYAIAAFDTNALDYLLKPFGKARFDRALSRARERLLTRPDREWMQSLLESVAKAAAPPEYVDRLAVQQNGRIVFVKTADIQWIESDGNRAVLHLVSARYFVRESLSALERSLNPKDFVRIHRLDHRQPALCKRTSSLVSWLPPSAA